MFWQLEEIYDNTDYLELIESQDSLRAFKFKLQAPGEYLTTFPVVEDYPDQDDENVYDDECYWELEEEWEFLEYMDEFEPDFDECYLEHGAIEYGHLDFYEACDYWSEMWH